MGVLIKNKINYTGSGDILNQPVIYSDSERCIGVWRDGKPLYQKTVKLTLTSMNTSIPLSGVGTFVKIEGFGCGEDGSIVCFPYYVSTPYFYYGYYDFSDSAVHIQCGRETLRYYSDFTATIQYTKTTDTAGTGPWAPTGATPIHYSLEEQVIGTWVDGKPLYQKTFVKTNLNIGSGITGFEIDLSDVSDVFYISGIIKESTHYFILPWAGLHSTGIEYHVEDHKIYMRSTDTFSNANVYFTLRYTKTTD